MDEKYDLIVTTNNIKKYLLKNRSLNKIVNNTRILSEVEFNKETVGKVFDNAVLRLMNEFNISYNLAKVYIKNILYKSEKLNKYYNFLYENNLIEFPVLKKYKSILLINVQIDDYYKDIYNEVVFECFSFENKYKHTIKEYVNLEDEVSSVFNEISKLLTTIDINKIKLVNVAEDYFNEIKKISSFFNIPINLNEKYSIYKTDTCKLFLDNLSIGKSLSDSLNVLEQNEIYDKLVTYFNNNDYELFDYYELEKIKDDLKNIYVDNKKINNALECINIEDIFEEDNYYFILGCNDGILPSMKKDEDFFSDREKENLDLLTSIDKNKFNKELVMNIFYGVKHLFLSYKLKSAFQSYRPSILIDDYNIEVIKYEKEKFKNSELYNKLELAKSLDNLIKFGEVNSNLNILYTNYVIPYLSYDNKFKGIDKNLFNEKINNITLSYTSINDYYNCSFKYYIKKILKLEESEETLALLIGNAFHYVLSKIYDSDFNFDKEYDFFLSKYTLDNKSTLFMDILKTELKYIIDVIYSFERKSNLNNNLLEKEVTVDNIKSDKVKLYGIIDKLKISDNKTLGIVIDYKTGSISTSVDNINYGLNLQLPIYIYLAKNLEPNIKIGGFYLQKILNNPKVDEEFEDRRKALKLEGFSISDENILKDIDSSYENSDVIKSLKMTSNGFASYSKVLSENQIDEITKIAEEKIKNAAENILNCNFDINPKAINNENIGCTYCKFKDLCFMKEEDVVNLENKKIKDILGGEADA